jgi:type VI secretion system protein ImpM
MEQGDAAGWFGKLAMLGDFASRRLTPDWVQACDEWLSACMEASRHDLGARWSETYLAAPVWRFAWGPGIVDERWWFGVLMPSCDRVGRYFPLVVTQVRHLPPTDRIALDHLELWWSHMGAAAMHTLTEGAALDAFEAELLQAPPWPGSSRSNLSAHAQMAPGHERHQMAAGSSLGDAAHALAAAQLLQRLRDTSVWTPWRGAAQAESLTLHEGLPPASAFAQMLVGDW